MRRIRWVALVAALLGAFAFVYGLTWMARGNPVAATGGIVGAALVAAILSLRES